VNGRALGPELARAVNRDAQGFEPDVEEVPLRAAVLGVASARCRQAAHSLFAVLTPAPLIMLSRYGMYAAVHTFTLTIFQTVLNAHNGDLF